MSAQLSDRFVFPAEYIPRATILPILGRSFILQPSQRTKTEAADRWSRKVLQTTYLCTFERLKGVRRRSPRETVGDTAGRAGPGCIAVDGSAGCRDYLTLQVFLRHLSAYIACSDRDNIHSVDLDFQRFIKTIRGLTPPFNHTNSFSIFMILTHPFRSYPTPSIYPVCHVKRCASLGVSHLREGLFVAPAGDTRQDTRHWVSPEIRGRNVFFVLATGRAPPWMWNLWQRPVNTGL